MSEPVTQRGWLGTSASFRHAMACLALVALTLGAFGNALRNGFVSFDDWFLIEENERIRSLSPRSIVAMFVKKDPSSHAWLPLRELSYAVDYHFWGLLPVGYHLTNVLLHGANVLLVYAVLVWLLRRPSLALLGAAAFAVHPAQVESVTWVSGRRDVLYAFFFLLSFLAFLAYGRGAGRRRWLLYGASLVCLAASLLSKASAMVLPAVLVLAVLVFGESDGRLWRRLAAIVPHGLLALAGTVVHFAMAQQAGVAKGAAFGASLANAPLIFAKYWQLLFFPVHLVVPYGAMSLKWATDSQQIALLAGVVAAVAVAAWWAAPRRSSAAFCVGWWFALLLPVANFIPISVLVADRYLYLPLLGACGFGADLAGSLMTRPWRKGVVAACAIAVLALLGLATHARNRVWANSLAFWEDGVSKWADTPLMRIGLGAAYMDANEYEKSWKQYMDVALTLGGRAASSNPEHVSLVLRGLGEFYDSLGRQREAEGRQAAALEVYEAMVRLSQSEKSAEPWVRLAWACERRGLWSRAREAVVAVQKLDPKYPGVEEWLTRLAAKQKGAEKAGPKE